ncbi:MAG TPA: head GIN domain-containing protein [Bacteroidia bacterium]|nr:head GIN domain-containing protein [Bacteroidia bacterium]
MMKSFKIGLFILCALTTFSCHKGPVCDCFDSAGAPTEENRTSALTYFEQINAEDDINVVLSMGNTEQVIIQGGSNLVHNISATVSNNILTLKNNNNCNWLRSYKKSIITVYITMPRVTYITNSGYGNITCTDTITTDTFNVRTTTAGDITLNVRAQEILGHLFGSGDITLNGHTDQFSCTFLSGIGFVYCSNLTTRYTFISNGSTGDAYVNSSGLIQAQIKGRGNIYYTGSAIVQQSIDGTGQVIKQ